MTDKPTYEALEAQVRALTKEVSNLNQSQGDLYLLNDYLKTLHETTLDLLEKRDLSVLLEAILTRVTGIFKTDTGFLYLLDEDEDKLVLKFGQGHFEKRIGYRLDRGAGLAGKVWQTGEPKVVDDYSSWEGRVPDPFWDSLQSIAGFPIKIQNKTIGVIGIHQIREEKAISQYELELIQRFSDLASLGLNNAHLYERLQRELIEHKQAEKALRESEKKFSKIFRSSPVGMVITSLADGKIIDVNDSFARITGYNLEEAIGLTSIETGFWIKPGDREKITQKLTKNGSFKDLEFDFRNKEGEICLAQVQSKSG